MADNIVLDSGTGGATVKTDEDIGGSHWQYVKIAFGADNTQTRVTSTVGMPVSVLSGALELGKLEDTAHSTGDAGVMALCVRNDTLAALVGTDGDYAPIQVNASGAVYTQAAGKVSSSNTTTDTLVGDAVFTGTSEDLLGYVTINIMVTADVSSATDGLSIEFSPDGTNWDFIQTHTVVGGTTFAALLRGKGRYMRIVYTNGNSAQSSFRLTTIVKSASVSAEIYRLDRTVDDSHEAVLTRAILSAKKPDDSYVNIQSTSGGNLKVSVEELNGVAPSLNTGTVDAGTQRVVLATDVSPPLSSGASTAANQLADGHNVTVDNASITVDNGGTFAVQSTLQTGSNAIGKLAANDGVDIGDVDVTSVVPGVGATNLGKAEDAAHTTGDVGVMSLAVRQDTAGTLAGADGDYTPFQVDADGNLRVVDTIGGSIVDDGNSTTSTLTSAQVFTGSGRSVKGYSAVGVLITASHDSAASGISLEFSPDNSNWDYIIPFTFDVSSEPSRFFQLPIAGLYFRVVYTNGGTNQSSFRMQTMLHTDPTLTTIHRVGDDFSADRSAQLMKSVLCAQKAGSGDFTPVDSTASGHLKIAVEEFDTSLPSGTNLMGDVGIGVRTSGGTTIFRSIDLDEGACEVVKASAGQIYWIHCINQGSSVRYLKIYNATSGTIGTGTPVLTFPIPTQGDSNGAGFTFAIPNGIAFSTGICLGASTGIADNDTGAPGANEVVLNLGYA